MRGIKRVHMADELRMATKRAMQAETTAGQIRSASDDGTLERKIARWEQLTSRKWGVAHG